MPNKPIQENIELNKIHNIDAMVFMKGFDSSREGQNGECGDMVGKTFERFMEREIKIYLIN